MQHLEKLREFRCVEMKNLYCLYQNNKKRIKRRKTLFIKVGATAQNIGNSKQFNEKFKLTHRIFRKNVFERP